LKNYPKSFNTAANEIGNPNDNSILVALVRGVDPDSEFGDWLAEKLPATLDRFYAKATQYIRKKEVR